MLIIKRESRDDLAKLFTGKGVEIGVEKGFFSQVICQTNPMIKLYCVDPYVSYRKYRDHTRQQKFDIFRLKARSKLRGFNVKFIQKFSIDAVKEFEDASLDFVYIDANHSYEFVIQDITEWAKKVKPGGIVAGHDYIRRKGQEHLYGVVQAVDEYIKANDYDLTVYRDIDNSPSWMFFKR